MKNKFLIVLVCMIAACTAPEQKVIPIVEQQNRGLNEQVAADTAEEKIERIAVDSFQGEKVYKVVEEMPVFGDCDKVERRERKKCSDKALISYISKNIKFPERAENDEVPSMFVGRFIITKTGEVKNIEALKSPGNTYIQSYLDVLENMPNWTSGKHKGKPIHVQYTIPIRICVRQ